jgi:hypothetical protein
MQRAHALHGSHAFVSPKLHRLCKIHLAAAITASTFEWEITMRLSWSTTRTVDFGASDAAMKPEDMAKVPGGVQLFPMTAGSIVLAYNLQGVNAIKLSRRAYSGIFLGTVKRWNDPLIAAANPGTALPDLPINVVVRADSSGTSFVFADPRVYLTS